MSGGGGGGVLSFFFIRRLGPSIYPSSQKMSGISSTPKNIWNLATQNISPILYLDLKKRPKNALKWPLNIVQVCDDPQKISTKSSYPQKYLFFLKPKKILKFKILNPQNYPSLRMYKNIRILPLPPPPPPCALGNLDSPVLIRLLALTSTFAARKYYYQTISRCITFHCWWCLRETFIIMSQ